MNIPNTRELSLDPGSCEVGKVFSSFFCMETAEILGVILVRKWLKGKACGSFQACFFCWGIPI